MPRKQGNLRVLRDTRIYGPMRREDVEDLLASRRIEGTDKLSVDEGEWMPLAEYMASTSAEEAESVTESTGPGSAWTAGSSPVVRREGSSQACLRLLQADRKFPPMTREQVLGLLHTDRVNGDDLICALDGPWMRVEDFFATRPPPTSHVSAPPPVATPVTRRGMVPKEIVEVLTDDDLVEDEASEAVGAEVLTEADLIDGPSQDMDELTEDDVIDAPPASLSTAGGRGVRSLLEEDKAQLADSWFVRVRGVHSAPLKRHHVRMLLEARELTPECLALHTTWRDTQWMPVKSIPQLAELLKGIQ